MISKISQQNIEHIFFFMMLDTAFYREKLNENRFVILIYYECRYAQFALSSVIELPRIPAYYPKLFISFAMIFALQLAVLIPLSLYEYGESTFVVPTESMRRFTLPPSSSVAINKGTFA